MKPDTRSTTSPLTSGDPDGNFNSGELQPRILDHTFIPTGSRGMLMPWIENNGCATMPSKCFAGDPLKQAFRKHSK